MSEDDLIIVHCPMCKREVKQTLDYWFKFGCETYRCLCGWEMVFQVRKAEYAAKNESREAEEGPQGDA